MLLVSTGFKIALLGPHAFADIFAGGELRLFAGVRPDSANYAQGDNLLGTIRRIDPISTGLRFELAGPYVVKPANDRWRFLCATPGTVGWWRLVGAGDDGGDSNSAPRIDGDVGTTAAPNDLTLAQVTFAAHDTLPIDSFLYTIPPLG